MKTYHDLYRIDLMGLRDSRWNDAFALARLSLDVLGKRCLTCGHRLWNNENGQRLYCDALCKNRQTRRRDRGRAVLREAHSACLYCGCDP